MVRSFTPTHQSPWEIWPFVQQQKIHQLRTDCSNAGRSLHSNRRSHRWAIQCRGNCSSSKDIDGRKTLAHLSFTAGPAEPLPLSWVDLQLGSSQAVSSIRGVICFLATSARQSSSASWWSGCLLSQREPHSQWTLIRAPKGSWLLQENMPPPLYRTLHVGGRLAYNGMLLCIPKELFTVLLSQCSQALA
jgi:hypothetical protein